MNMMLSELAAKLGLTLQGADKPFTGLNTLEAASPTEVTFLANPKYTAQLKNTRACAVILTKDMASQAPSAALISGNPYMDFARAGELFVRKPERLSGISPLAVVHETAVLGEGTAVYPHAFIGPGAVLGRECVVYPGVFLAGNVTLGDRCVLYPHSVVMDGVVMGNDCVLHSGAVIGTDGFGFIRVEGRMLKIPQIGGVHVADGVDIGANSCVDRATLGATMVGKDTKIDNLVQIGHNVRIGEQCLLVSQVGIAGSTRVGDRVTMAGQAGISGHLNIGDDVTIGPMAGVAKDIRAGATGGGVPFQEGSAYMRTILLTTKLPDMNRRIQQLEKELALLKRQLAGAGPEEKA